MGVAMFRVYVTWSSEWLWKWDCFWVHVCETMMEEESLFGGICVFVLRNETKHLSDFAFFFFIEASFEIKFKKRR